MRHIARCKDGSQYPEGRNAVYEKLRTHKKLDQLGVKLDKKRTAEADGAYIHVVRGLRLKAVHELCDDET